jgi:hypothetical protein
MREGERLEGRHTFEFSIQLPFSFEVNHGSGSNLARYSLPPFFTEKAARVRVHYGIILSVKRGALSSDER